MALNYDRNQITTIGEWKPTLFHERLIAHIKQAGIEQTVVAAMRYIGNQHAADWFKSLDDEKSRFLGEAKFQTVARLCMVLDKLGHPVQFDELLAEDYVADSVADRIRKLENYFRCYDAFDAVITRTLAEFTKSNTDKLREVLEDTAQAISEGVARRHLGHITGREGQQISKHSKHIRVISSRMDFGMDWDPLTGEPSVHPSDFRAIALQLATTRHTFIVPGADPGCVPPSPFLGEDSITWAERVKKFGDLFLTDPQITEEHWEKNIIFRHTSLPIPASVVLFGLSADGYTDLKNENPALVDDLCKNNSEFIHRTTDRGAFIGVVIPGSDAPKLSTLMNRRSILFSSSAFIQYWSHLPQDQRKVDPDPRRGLPTGSSSEY